MNPPPKLGPWTASCGSGTCCVGLGRSGAGFVPELRASGAAAAVGVDAIFMEVHEDPDHALSDGPNSYPLALVAALLGDVRRIDELARESAARG